MTKARFSASRLSLVLGDGGLHPQSGGPVPTKGPNASHKAELQENLGRIARSGTANFVKDLGSGEADRSFQKWTSRDGGFRA